MSYLADYHWDVFVSYALSDNAPIRPGEKGWVSTFVDDLLRAVESYLGEPIGLFSDRETRRASLEDLAQAAARAAIMLIVASPGYTRSEWTGRELEAFLSARGRSGRVFVVEYLPLAPGDSYPGGIDDLIGAQFWRRSPGTSVPVPLKPATAQYQARLLKVAHEIQRQLRAIRHESAPIDEEPDEPAVLPPGAAQRPPRIFISYASEDRDRIRPLANLLEQAGHDVWWDPQIEIGSSFRKAIAAALERADFILVAWSHNSVDSEWVQEEAEVGKARRCLKPVLIDPVVPPIGFRSYQNLNLSNWDQRQDDPAIQRLLDQLSRAPSAATGS